MLGPVGVSTRDTCTWETWGTWRTLQAEERAPQHVVLVHVERVLQHVFWGLPSSRGAAATGWVALKVPNVAGVGRQAKQGVTKIRL